MRLITKFQGERKKRKAAPSPQVWSAAHAELVWRLVWNRVQPLLCDQTLTLTRDYAAELKKPFPQINSTVLQDSDWPKDCYVFEGKEEEPTVVYMPLFNRHNCKGLFQTHVATAGKKEIRVLGCMHANKQQTNNKQTKHSAKSRSTHQTPLLRKSRFWVWNWSVAPWRSFITDTNNIHTSEHRLYFNLNH